MDAVDVSGVESDGVSGLCLHILESQEVIGYLRWASHLTGPLQAQYQQVQYQAIVLDHEGRELQASDHTIRVGMVHVLPNTRGQSTAYVIGRS